METKNTQITPLFDRILCVPEPEQLINGLIVPKGASDRSHFMVVTAAGPEARTVQPNDRIIVAKYAGTEVTLGDTTYTLVTECDILGVLK